VPCVDFLDFPQCPCQGGRAPRAVLFATFPDFHYRIIESTAEDDRVVCKVMMTGTHRGEPLMPQAFGGMLAGVAPTGKPVEVLQFHSFRIRDSYITEHSAVRDDLGMLKQLGLVTPKAV
jgi:predicted ester cyclase